MRENAGFSLIELLIVVAIIALLVAIAVPNYLHAQVRAKVARAISDLRTLNTGLEAYAADFGNYPRGNWYQLSTRLNASGSDRGLILLSTPIAYISQALLDDPFPTLRRYTPIPGQTIREDDDPERVWYKFTARREGGTVGTEKSPDWDRWSRITEWYILQSSGPDCTRFTLGQGAISVTQPQYFQDTLYDPSNGTTSRGSLYRAGGWPTGPGTLIFSAIAQANR